jgi:hypothetical protein
MHCADSVCLFGRVGNVLRSRCMCNHYSPACCAPQKPSPRHSRGFAQSIHPVASIKDLIAFYRDRVDIWCEKD